MNWFVYLIYVCLVGLIRVYKWVELRVLLLFTPFLKRKGKEMAASVNIILHCPGDSKNDEDLSKICRNSKYKKTIHIHLKDNKFFARWANTGSLAGAMTYVDKTWDTETVEDLTEMTVRALENNMMDYFYHPLNRWLEWIEFYAFNLQTKKRAFQVGQAHYDLGNDLYEAMLDPWMQYTCGYWKDGQTNLNDAQIAKMELIAKKLELKPGMRVLDIGSGWGFLCKYLAIHYKVECVGVTISEEQVSYAKELCKGLPCEFRLQDYRDVNEQFDRIVSVGMFEHVGHWNYREYFKTASKCLVHDGIFLLHTIGRNHYNYPQRSDPFSSHFIFPNGELPSLIEIAEATKDVFVMEDWQNFGQHYARTLNCWRSNFIENWPKLQKNYDERFYRLWICYLSLAQGLFKSRRAQLWQIVLSKDGLKREYVSVR